MEATTEGFVKSAVDWCGETHCSLSTYGLRSGRHVHIQYLHTILSHNRSSNFP